MISLSSDSLLTLSAGDNRFSAGLIDAINAGLDDVERSIGPTALVVTGDTKFFSNGVDLDDLSSISADQLNAFFTSLLGLWARLLTFPLPTVAAINGHAFGAGAMFTCEFDQRIMRADRGYWCLPEAQLGLGLHPGMTANLLSRIPEPTLTRAVTTSARFGGIDAAKNGIVDTAAHDPLEVAHAVAAELSVLASPTLRALKRDLHKITIEALES